MGFPPGDYSPFGLVANPWAFARSWTEGEGGSLRATEQGVGLAWVTPWNLHPVRGLGLEIGFALPDARLRFPLTRRELEPFKLSSPYHSSGLIEFRWEHEEVTYQARLFAVGPDALVARWAVENASAHPRTVTIRVGCWAWQQDERAAAAELDGEALRDAITSSTWDTGWLRGEFPGEIRSWPEAEHDLRLAGESVWFGARETVASRPGIAIRRVLESQLDVPPHGTVVWAAALGRGPDADDASRKALETWRHRETDLVAEDNAFWETCPRLAGDWPREFRNGLVYDFETTRMCVQPAGGIFRDIWPAWMVNWPRVVLAEGSLDMLRLSFARPDLAERAVLSLFRDAPAPNVPCVFRHGEPNMVAEDGSICGTSPAWCLPFYNIRRLYLRTLDTSWLAELYPYLEAYVRWWLTNRSDQEGWTVYRCTWEAGEDNSTRLDPDAEGDHVISNYARPIELQAAMADAIATLAFFQRELADHGRWTMDSASSSSTARAGRSAIEGEWGALETAFRERVQRLWDPGDGRFRDLDARRDAFIEPIGRNDYWGTDPRRFSALSFTPLLFGQTTPEQEAALRREIEHYDRPPWCDWPSWSYVVLEAASRAGWYEFAGRMAYGICRRVYAENDRRDLLSFDRPMPGAAREYWPSDLTAWDASEGYGWGATTASYVIRQLSGFYEAEDTLGCAFRLAPGFPDDLLADRELRLGPLPYRGRVLDFAYRLAADGKIAVTLKLAEPAGVLVTDERSGEVLFADGAAAAHTLRLSRWACARVELDP